ncbi:MAG: acyltransferase [Rickettsiales bacterium]
MAQKQIKKQSKKAKKKADNSMVKILARLRFAFTANKPQVEDGGFIHPLAQLEGNLKNIKIGKNAVIERGAKLVCKGNGRLEIGEKTIVKTGAYLHTVGGNGKIIIGSDCSVHPYCVMYGPGGIEIGNHVRIATHTAIVAIDHIFDDPNQLIRSQGNKELGIKIGNDVWIGAGARVLDGVEIGEGCVIGAGAVVTKNTVPYSVNVGCPARKIKSRKDLAKAA